MVWDAELVLALDRGWVRVWNLVGVELVLLLVEALDQVLDLVWDQEKVRE